MPLVFIILQSTNTINYKKTTPMKNFIFHLLFGLIACSTLQAQPLEKTLLWEISHSEIKQPSYIYGTIHMTCETTLDDRVKNAIKNTELLVLEIDMDDPQMTSTMMKHMIMPNSKSVDKMLSSEDYKFLSDFTKTHLGMPLDLLKTVKPFMISAMFYPKLLDCPIQSVENNLMLLSKAQGNEVLGLESVEDQMKAIDSISYEDQVADLLRSAKDNLEEHTTQFKSMLELYKNEDIEGLLKLVEEDETWSVAQYQNAMLYDRNKNWIPKIAEFSKSQPTFIGVGAAHLAGDEGVLNLLRKAGYSIKPAL